MRLEWLAVGAIAAAGCHTPPAASPGPEPVRSVAADPSPTPPPRGEGLRQAAPSPPSFPGKGDGRLGSDADPLALAAQCLEAGDRSAACTHLETYVRGHPEQIMFRAHLAELLLQLDRPAEARRHFERFVVDARDATGTPRTHLVHCHTRLMEIGQRTGDRFAELYHRGIGLLLLVREHDRDPATRDDEFCEEVLCKAMAALAEAKELRPSDGRVRLCLADVYERAGNRRAAEVERTAALRCE